MRTHMPALLTITLVAFASQANAGPQCPELIRLRSEAAQASKRTMGVPAPSRCEAYNRVAAAWSAITGYANDHRDSCDVTDQSLNELEQYRREAVKARDNVCAGRPARPFPPDIIER
jgi:hypothetical protein